MKQNKEKGGTLINRRNAAIAIAEGLGMVAFTTAFDHREITHRSIKSKPLMHTLGRIVAFSLGRVPRYWGRTHISHHSARDANLLNILETADCLEYLAANPGKTEAKIPILFKGLDPVAQLTAKDVMEIGASIRQEVKDRYDPPTDYTKENLQRLLDDTSPRYFYPSKGKQSAEDLIRSGSRSVERLRSVLVDPHSPALHKHGVPGILIDNVPLFRANQRDVQAMENIGEYNLHKDKWDELLFDKHKLGLTAFFLGNIALQIGLNKDRSLKGLTKSVIGGFAVSAAIGQIYKIGGDVTNSLGHLGDDLIEALFGKPKVKNDGTYSYNAKIFNFMTFDEVGGQYDHHAKPGKIAYTDNKGIRKVMSAPFGSFLEFLADRNILFEHGDQYGHPEVVNDVLTLESERQFIRPDEPMKAVLMLEKARVRTLQAA